MGMTDSVYRIPGRVLPGPPPPWPSSRTLAAPLLVASIGLAALLVPLLVFNLWLAPRYVLAPGTSFVPGVDVVQDGAAWLLLGALPVALVLVAKRVVPQWRRFGLGARIGYVAAVVLVQLALVGGAEIALLESRGGLRLFEPTLVGSFTADDGRTAYVFRGGLLTSEFVVHVADKGSLLMTKQLVLERRNTAVPPNVRWNADGSVVLVDDTGAVLEAQPSPPFLGWFGGC